MNLTHDDVRDLAAGYVLGALTPDEEAAVRDHLATCAEPHPEFAELGGVVPYLAASLEPVEPPAGLRDRLMAAAAAERPAADRTAVDAPAPPAGVTAPGPVPVPVPYPSADQRAVRDADRRGRFGVWAMGIAAVLAIAVLGAWNLQLQARLSDVEGALAAAATYEQGVASVLQVATQAGAQVAILSPAPDSPAAATGLAATGPDGTVVITMHGLAATTGNEVYEAWVIVGSEAPVPLGDFKVGEAGTGVFRGSTALAAPGAILALTREPGPGATTPTVPVLTIGVLSSNS
jgi:anti-sigma factor RsiW